MTATLYVLGALCVVIGLVGVVLPALPGTLLIVIGLGLAAWAEGFTRVGMGTLVAIGLIGALSYGIDFAAAALGAQRLGATRHAMVGAALGTVAGLFLGLPGIVLGPFVGAVVGEWIVNRDLRRAGHAGVAAWVGFALGTVVKVGVAFVMVAMFLAALVF
jgi:uncharacterized protein YqgC (DUF456 family)